MTKDSYYLERRKLIDYIIFWIHTFSYNHNVGRHVSRLQFYINHTHKFHDDTTQKYDLRASLRGMNISMQLMNNLHIQISVACSEKFRRHDRHTRFRENWAWIVIFQLNFVTCSVGTTKHKYETNWIKYYEKKILKWFLTNHSNKIEIKLNK